MLQSNQTGCRFAEATGIEIERAQVLFEVDVKPFALRGTRFIGCRCDKRCTNSPSLAMPGDHRVQDESMNSPVPDNVDEADQRAVFPRADPAEAVALESCSPVSPRDRVAEAVSVQRIKGCIAEVAPPLVLDRHSPIVVSVPTPVRITAQGDCRGLRRPDTAEVPRDTFSAAVRRCELRR